MKRCGYPDAVIQKRVSDLKQQDQRLQSSSPRKSSVQIHAEYAIERQKEEDLRRKFIQLIRNKTDSASTK
jgi:hypothetical protein